MFCISYCENGGIVKWWYHMGWDNNKTGDLEKQKMHKFQQANRNNSEKKAK